MVKTTGQALKVILLYTTPVIEKLNNDNLIQAGNRDNSLNTLKTLCTPTYFITSSPVSTSFPSAFGLG